MPSVIVNDVAAHSKHGSALGCALALVLIFLTSCGGVVPQGAARQGGTQKEEEFMLALLEKSGTDSVERYTILNRLMASRIDGGDWSGVATFLTDYVARHSDDPYNSYWLLMAAYAYLRMDAKPFAEYYFDRILRTSSDLMVKGESIHYLCLKNLIQISRTPRNRVRYFNDLITRYPQKNNVTELYYRLALEYEKDNEWDSALAAFRQYLARPDASTIQIAGEPNAFNEAHRLVDFYNSRRDWTFSTLDELASEVKRAIAAYDWRALDRLRTRVNFFSVSWKQDGESPKTQENFSMRSYMRGQKITFSSALESGNTSGEAYLRTSGWSQYVPVWYLYFRRVNFPIDPEINGNWEWAGIYIGDRL